MRVLVDSRERMPWKFTGGVATKVKKLKVGDYSLWGYTGLIVVERKALADWVNCCTTKWKQLQSQLDRLARVDYSCIIVESTVARVRDRRYRCLASPDQLLGRTAEIAAYWAVPVIYAEDRALAASTCIQFFEHSKRAIQEASHA